MEASVLEVDDVLSCGEDVIPMKLDSALMPSGGMMRGDSDAELELRPRRSAGSLSKLGRGGLSFQHDLQFLIALSISIAMNLYDDEENQNCHPRSLDLLEGCVLIVQIVDDSKIGQVALFF